MLISEIILTRTLRSPGAEEVTDVVAIAVRITADRCSSAFAQATAALYRPEYGTLISAKATRVLIAAGSIAAARENDPQTRQDLLLNALAVPTSASAAPRRDEAAIGEEVAEVTGAGKISGRLRQAGRFPRAKTRNKVASKLSDGLSP